MDNVLASNLGDKEISFIEVKKTGSDLLPPALTSGRQEFNGIDSFTAK